MPVNDSVATTPIRSGPVLLRWWTRLRRHLTAAQPRRRCLLCSEYLTEEKHGWYSVWHCSEGHFSEALLNRGVPLPPTRSTESF